MLTKTHIHSLYIISLWGKLALYTIHSPKHTSTLSLTHIHSPILRLLLHRFLHIAGSSAVVITMTTSNIPANTTATIT